MTGPFDGGQASRNSIVPVPSAPSRRSWSGLLSPAVPAPRIAVHPEASPGWLADAVWAGGATVVPLDDAEALVWADPNDPEGLAATVGARPHLRWVQLPWAGIEPYREVIDDARVWTCGKGVYAEPVAELALTMLLAGLRGAVRYARVDHWSDQFGTSLFDGKVTIVGGGGIAEVLARLLVPYRAEVTVVRRRPAPMDHVARVVGVEDLHDALRGADGVVLALALVPDTVGIIGRAELEAMEDHAWLVNVARGRHVVTDDLVEALRREVIGGAGLDVTDPEPLPDGHPLWSIPNCVITPHVGNTREMAKPLLSARITENVRRWAAGEDLIGPVDPKLGY
jgi:phosphoglycerate dehydrogenase-like enzyme